MLFESITAGALIEELPTTAAAEKHAKSEKTNSTDRTILPLFIKSIRKSMERIKRLSLASHQGKSDSSKLLHLPTILFGHLMDNVIAISHIADLDGIACGALIKMKYGILMIEFYTWIIQGRPWSRQRKRLQK